MEPEFKTSPSLKRGLWGLGYFDYHWLSAFWRTGTSSLFCAPVAVRLLLSHTLLAPLQPRAFWKQGARIWIFPMSRTQAALNPRVAFVSNSHHTNGLGIVLQDTFKAILTKESRFTGQIIPKALSCFLFPPSWSTGPVEGLGSSLCGKRQFVKIVHILLHKILAALRAEEADNGLTFCKPRNWGSQKLVQSHWKVKGQAGDRS